MKTCWSKNPRPVLFMVFVNNLSSLSSVDQHLMVYAGDTNLVVKCGRLYFNSGAFFELVV